MSAQRAAAIVLAALLATGCSTGQGVGGATPSAASPAASIPASPGLPSDSLASPSPATPTPISPPALPVGALRAGETYSVAVIGTQRLLVTVPASGWITIDTWFLGKDDAGAGAFNMTLLPYQVANVYTDPCRWLSSASDPRIGPTVDDLATALSQQAGAEAVAPTDVALDGYLGKKVELTIPDDVDTATCDEGDFGRWSPLTAPSGYGPFTYGNGQHDIVYIVDVDGTRWVIDTNYLPGTSAASLAELEQLVASIRFEG